MRTAVTLFVFLLLSWALPASASNARTFHLVVVSGDFDSPHGKSMRLWSELIEKRSSGRLRVNVFYQNELGGQQEVFDQLLKGNLHMVLAL